MHSGQRQKTSAKTMTERTFRVDHMKLSQQRAGNLTDWPLKVHKCCMTASATVKYISLKRKNATQEPVIFRLGVWKSQHSTNYKYACRPTIDEELADAAA